MQRILEHMIYFGLPRARVTSDPRLEVETLSDAEGARVLSVITPEGTVLRVERVPTVRGREEESCASGC